MVRALIAVGLLMMLLLLRLESERFAAAEYDEPENRYHRGFWTRLAWSALGLLLIAGIYKVHPDPRDVLYLAGGHRLDVLVYGLTLAGVGVAQAAIFALYRYGGLRFPAPLAYPGAAINAVATAFIDEATFRGVLLGMILAMGFPAGSAVLVETIVYILVTRAAAPGHHPYVLFMAALMGLAGGWVTLATGGIGAAILAHAVTSFGVFVFTGHAGQVLRAGREPEEIEWLRRPPPGWQEAPLTGALLRPVPGSRVARPSGRGAEPLGLDDQVTRVLLASRDMQVEPRNLELLRSDEPEPEPVMVEPQNLFPPEPEAPAEVEEAETAAAAGVEPAAAAGAEQAAEAEPADREPASAGVAAVVIPRPARAPIGEAAAAMAARLRGTVVQTLARLDLARLTAAGAAPDSSEPPARPATLASASPLPVPFVKRLRSAVGSVLDRIDPARQAGPADATPPTLPENAPSKAPEPGRAPGPRGRGRSTLPKSGSGDGAAVETTSRGLAGGSGAKEAAHRAQPGPPPKTSRHKATNPGSRSASDPRRHRPGE